MQTYLERYRAGERKQVWAELVARGPVIREEPLYADAQAVAREMMRRARHNVEQIVKRLSELAYHFVYPDAIWIPSTPVTQRLLDTLEQAYEPLPMSLRTWYELVGSVNFMGAHRKLSTYLGPVHNPWSRSEQLGVSSDPLVMYPLMLTPEPFYLDYADDDKTFEEDDDKTFGEIEGPFFHTLGPDRTLKAGQSGGDSIEIMFPNPVFDTILLGQDWGGVLFIPYLRTCFAWGGFPGLRDQPEAAAAQEELAFLTKDLLPI